MKFLVCLFLSLLLVLPMLTAYSIIPEPVTNQKPQIEVEFNELVRVNDYKLRSPTHYPGQLFEVSQDTINPARIFYFNVDETLQPGDYEFFVKATNAAERTINEYVKFTIAGTPKPSFRITVEEPPLGVALEPPYDVIVATTKAADCRFTLGANPVDIYNLPPDELFNLYLEWFFETPEFTKRHSLTQVDYNQWIPITCLDDEGKYYFDEIYLGWDNTPPVVQVFAEPNPVTDPASAKTHIKVTSDDPTICWRDGSLFEDSIGEFSQDPFELYTTTHDESIIYTVEELQPNPFEPKHKQYSILCENLAGLQSTAITMEILVDLTKLLSIKKLSPGDYTNEAAINFTIEMSATGACSLTTIDGGDRVQPMLSQDGKIFNTFLSSLSDGPHTVGVRCTSVSGEQEGSFSFIIDRTAPTQSKIDALPGCKENRLEASFFSNDTESGVAGYNYTLTKGTEIIRDWTFTAKENIIVETETLTGEEYNWGMIPVDIAGNSGLKATARVHVYNKSAAICDDIPPRIDFLENKTDSSMIITVLCKDDQSGCKESYWYGSSGVNDFCEYNKSQGLTRPIQIWETQKICARVMDYNENNVSKVEVYTFGPDQTETPRHCMNNELDNDETDVDCGGECLPCGAGMGCESNEDCETEYCNPETKLCAGHECDDNIKNGDETDVDCGGPFCDACDANSGCDIDEDCASGVCMNTICQTPSCTDGAANGDETDVDCGGSCEGCPLGDNCQYDADCKSGYCDASGFCIEEQTADSDGDGMPDEWELRYNLDPSNPSDADEDPDDDGLTNYEEYQAGTNPQDRDTDGDGYTDGEELAAGTDPNSSDSYPKSNTFSILFIILGILCILGGSGFLVYARIYMVPKKVHTPLSMSAFAEPQQASRVFTPGIDPLADAARTRLEEKTSRQRRLQKNIKHKSLFEKFSNEKTLIPIEKTTPVKPGENKDKKRGREKKIPVKKTTVKKKTVQKPSKKKTKSQKDTFKALDDMIKK